MDKYYRERARQLIDVGNETGEHKCADGNTVLQFPRVTWNDVYRIEALIDEEVIEEYHKLAEIYEGSPTIREIQLESLFAWEVRSRGLFERSAKIWREKLGES